MVEGALRQLGADCAEKSRLRRMVDGGFEKVERCCLTAAMAVSALALRWWFTGEEISPQRPPEALEIRDGEFFNRIGHNETFIWR